MAGHSFAHIAISKYTEVVTNYHARDIRVTTRFSYYGLCYGANMVPSLITLCGAVTWIMCAMESEVNM